MSDEETILLKGDRTKDVDEQYQASETTKKRTCKETLMKMLKRNSHEDDEGKIIK